MDFLAISKILPRAYDVKGMLNAFQQCLRSASGFRRGGDHDVPIPQVSSTFIKSISGEHRCALSKAMALVGHGPVKALAV